MTQTGRLPRRHRRGGAALRPGPPGYPRPTV